MALLVFGVLKSGAEQPRWIAAHDRKRRHVTGDDRSCGDYRTITDGNAAKHYGVCSNPNVSSDGHAVMRFFISVANPRCQGHRNPDHVSFVIPSTHNLHTSSDECEVTNLPVDFDDHSPTNRRMASDCQAMHRANGGAASNASVFTDRNLPRDLQRYSHPPD